MEKYTNFTLRIPVFKDGKMTAEHMDFLSRETKTLDELVVELREVFKMDAGITNIRKSELVDFITHHGVWDELSVEIISDSGTKLIKKPFGEAIHDHAQALYREAIKVVDDGVPSQDGVIIGLGFKQPSLQARLEAGVNTVKSGVVVKGTV